MKIKDYKEWMSLKSSIHNSHAHPLGIRERDIWICNIGENIGFAEKGDFSEIKKQMFSLLFGNKS